LQLQHAAPRLALIEDNTDAFRGGKRSSDRWVD